MGRFRSPRRSGTVKNREPQNIVLDTYRVYYYTNTHDAGPVLAGFSRLGRADLPAAPGPDPLADRGRAACAWRVSPLGPAACPAAGGEPDDDLEGLFPAGARRAGRAGARAGDADQSTVAVGQRQGAAAGAPAVTGTGRRHRPAALASAR